MEAQAIAQQQRYPPEPPLSFLQAQPRGALAQQLYPPELAPSFPPDTALADQPYPPEPPLTFPVLDDVDTRGLRAETNALTAEDLSRLSVGHAKSVKAMNPSQLYTTAGLFMIVVGVILVAVVRRKERASTATKKSDAQGRSVAFTDSYEPFLG